MIIKNAKVFMDDHFEEGIDVRISGSKIAEIQPNIVAEQNEEVLDAVGHYLLPGFVDVHIHACVGNDTMNGEDNIRAMARFLRTQGVSAFLPTTMSASVADTAKAIAAIRAVIDRPQKGECKVLGAHMEAPFLAEKKCGAQLKEFFMDPSKEAFVELTGGDTAAVRIMTIAPERNGSEEFVRWATKQGIVISLGHTAADAAKVHEAGEWGANHITHTFNAQTPLQHREPGVPGAAMADDRFYCEMICDGIHLHPDIAKMLARAKSASKAVVITDAMEAAGMPDGKYSLGGQDVFVKEGAARLADGTLAGSILTMPVALQNLIRFGIQPEQAARMCTATPAESIHEQVIGHMKAGSPAPLTLWNEQWTEMQIIE